MFYSNGKLLLTGEYVVLDGAKALAVPTRFGQNLIVKKGINQQINWVSFDADKSIWFQDSIAFHEIIDKQLSENNPSVKEQIYKRICEFTILQYKKDSLDTDNLVVDASVLSDE